MASASYQFRAASFDRASPRRRASGLALALGVNLLLLFVLLGIGAFRPEPVRPTSAIVVDMLPNADDRPLARDQQKAEQKPLERTRPQPPKPPKIPPITSPIPPKVPLQMLELTKEEYAKSDIGTLPKAESGAAGAAGHADDSQVAGRGPRGETLYAAEWARKPTNAELEGYLPPNPPDGYGLIACKTAPQNRVEDCVELENYPRGSRLASAVRQAAWQFRVRPVRKNGRELIGEWVSIRIEYSFNRVSAQ